MSMMMPKITMPAKKNMATSIGSNIHMGLASYSGGWINQPTLSAPIARSKAIEPVEKGTDFSIMNTPATMAVRMYVAKAKKTLASFSRRLTFFIFVYAIMLAQGSQTTFMRVES